MTPVNAMTTLPINVHSSDVDRFLRENEPTYRRDYSRRYYPTGPFRIVPIYRGFRVPYSERTVTAYLATYHA